MSEYRRRATDRPATRGRRRVVGALTAVTAIMLASALLTIGAVLVGNRDATRRIQTERARAALLACRSQNDQNATIVSFIAATAPHYLQAARRAFPQQDCPSVVREQVTK